MPISFYFYELEQKMEDRKTNFSQFFIYTHKMSSQNDTVYMGKLEVETDDVSVALVEFIKSLGRTPVTCSTRSIATNPEAWIADCHIV